MRNKSLKTQNAVEKNSFQKIRFLIKLLSVVVFTVFLALFYIWSRIEVVKIGYEIGELQKHQKVLKAHHQKLKMELSVLKSPTRIEKLALDQLKMIWPTPEMMYPIKKPANGS